MLFATAVFSGLIGSLVFWKAPVIINYIRSNVSKQAPKFQSNNTEIKRQIIAEVPLLQSRKPKTEFEIVNALREWVFYTVPVTDQLDLKIEDIRNVSSAVNIPLGERLLIFERGEAGAWCSATASTLRDIYELFGFESYVVHVGDLPERAATHSFTLVKIQSNGTEMFVVQDAYRNYVLVDIHGSPFDYFEILDLLQRKNDHNIVFLFGQNLYKPRLIEENGKKIIREPFDLSAFDTRVEQFVSSYGYPSKFLYILLFPYGVYSSNFDAAERLLATAQSITGNWCSNVNDTCLQFK